MPTRNEDHERQLERIVDGMVESILEAPEDEIDEDLRAAGADPERAADETREVIAKTLERRRKRALRQRARERYERNVRAIEDEAYPLPETPEERRRLLAGVLAARPQAAQALTLQFRNLESMPDEDVASLLRQLFVLGAMEDRLSDDE